MTAPPTQESRVRWNSSEGINIRGEFDKEFHQMYERAVQLNQEEVHCLAKLASIREEKRGIARRHTDMNNILQDALKRIRTLDSAPPPPSTPQASPPPPSTPQASPPPSTPHVDVTPPVQTSPKEGEEEKKCTVRIIIPGKDTTTTTTTTRTPIATRSPVPGIVSYFDLMKGLREVNTKGYVLVSSIKLPGKDGVEANGMTEVKLKTDADKKALIDFYIHKCEREWSMHGLYEPEEIEFHTTMRVLQVHGNRRSVRCVLCKEDIPAGGIRVLPWGESVCCAHYFHIGCGLLAKTMVKPTTKITGCLGKKFTNHTCKKGQQV
jgi:hypothetical protein